jgi:adenylosuccinate lyase
LRAWDEELDFHELLRADAEVSRRLDARALASLFDPGYHLRYVDDAYRRLGLPADAVG